MTIASRIAVATFSLLIATSAVNADTPVISHTPLSCVPEGKQHAKVIARIDRASSARVYFRASQVNDVYYVEMLKNDNGLFWAALPLPQDQTQTAVYRVVAKGANGETTSTINFSIPVVDSCAPFKFTDSEIPITENLVVGWMNDDVTLHGWRCEHVSNRVTPRNEMRRWDGCVAGLLPSEKAAILAGLIPTIGLIDIVNNQPKDRPVSPVRP